MHHILRSQGLRFCPCRQRRTVSRESDVCVVSATRRPASSSSVQRARPAGGAVHAVATNSACCAPESLRMAPARGALGQCRLHTSLNTAALGARHRRSSYTEAARDRFIPQAPVGRQEDLSALDTTNRGMTSRQQFAQQRALVVVEIDTGTDVHRPAPWQLQPSALQTRCP
jgi:hypothetical protein